VRVPKPNVPLSLSLSYACAQEYGEQEGADLMRGDSSDGGLPLDAALFAHRPPSPGSPPGAPQLERSESNDAFLSSVRASPNRRTPASSARASEGHSVQVPGPTSACASALQKGSGGFHLACTVCV
jgi:hypothetical protein